MDSDGGDWRRTEPFPHLMGPPDTTEGYYELDAVERGYAFSAMSRNVDAVSIWYRALALYRRGMLGSW